MDGAFVKLGKSHVPIPLGRRCECNRSYTCDSWDDLPQALRDLKAWCLQADLHMPNSAGTGRNRHCAIDRVAATLSDEAMDAQLANLVRRYPNGAIGT